MLWCLFKILLCKFTNKRCPVRLLLLFLQITTIITSTTAATTATTTIPLVPMHCRSPVKRRPQTRLLVSIHLCSVLPPYLAASLHEIAVTVSFSASPFQVFFGRPLFLRPRGVHCSACITMLSSLLITLSKPVSFFSRSYIFIRDRCVLAQMP